MDIRELADAVTLRDVIPVERYMTLNADPDEGLREWGEPSPEGEVTLNLQVNQVSWDTRIETWFRMVVEHPRAKLMAAFSVVYERTSEDEIPNSVRREFLEMVSVMAAMPYIRASIQALAAEARIGNLVLPIVRQGEVNLEDVSEDSP